MKRKLGILLAVLLTFGMSVGTFADAGKTQQVDYKTDYYMIVESPDGGIDMYSEADLSSPKLNDELIPNGTAIHVEGETKDDAGKIWVYAQLHNVFGFLEENYLKPVTLAEAVASELSLYGSQDANYDITVNAKKDGSLSLYKGPGKKYGTVSGGCNIANGEKLHIDSEVDTGKDGVWGLTAAGDVSGWVNIAEATNTEESTVELVPETKEESSESGEDGNQSKVGKSSAAEASGKLQATNTPAPKDDKTSTLTPEPTKAATATPEPTKAATATPEPTKAATATPEPTKAATATPKPTKAATATPEPTKAATATPEPTEAATATPEPTEAATATLEPTEAATATPEPTEAATATPEPVETLTPTEEPAATEAPADDAQQETSSENVESTSKGMHSAIWILIIVIIIGVVIVVWLLKKKDKNNESK